MNRIVVLLVFIIALTGCSCRGWQLYSSEQISRKFVMHACTNYLFDSTHIRKENYLTADERANKLLKTSSNALLRDCHTLGTASVAGRQTALAVECSQPIKGNIVSGYINNYLVHEEK